MTFLESRPGLESQGFDRLVATREAKIGIVGLGYAGLPLALAFCDAGFDVTGIDVNTERVADVNARRSYLADVPSDRYPAIDGQLVATTDFEALADLDAITICVPTPMSKSHSPDLSYIVAAAEAVRATAGRGSSSSCNPRRTRAPPQR